MFKFKNETVRNVAEGGGRALAALALMGGIGAGLYALDRQVVAPHHAETVDNCAGYDTPEARERCVDDADGLRHVVGLAEATVGASSVIVGGAIAIDGVATAFGYDWRRRETASE